jgi:biotin operon repressor
MQDSTHGPEWEGLTYQTPDDLAGDMAAEDGHSLDPADLEAAVEAILFASGDPVTLERIASVTGLQRDHARKVLQDLKSRMEADRSRGVTIQQIRDTYVLSTKPEMNPVMRVLFQPPTVRLCLRRPMRRWRSSPIISLSHAPHRGGSRSQQ